MSVAPVMASRVCPQTRQSRSSGARMRVISICSCETSKGARKNAAMSVVSHDVVKDDALDLAEYFAGKPWPKNDAPLASVADATTAAALDNSVPCRVCHFDHFQGNSSVPRLAGQQHDYLVKTLTDYRNHTRANNPAMSELLNSVTPEQIEAMASYLSGL